MCSITGRLEAQRQEVQLDICLPLIGRRPEVQSLAGFAFINPLAKVIWPNTLEILGRDLARVQNPSQNLIKLASNISEIVVIVLFLPV